MKWVIFDLDGTLSRTDIFIVPSIWAAMEDTGLGEWTTEEIRMTIGERTEETNLKLFGEERCARADGFWKLVEYYQDNVYKDMETVYDGVPELLDSLHQKGYRTAVCSNADRTYIEMMLGRLGIRDKIDKIRPVIPGKDKAGSLAALMEEVKPEAAVMVGDRIYDVAAAKANQVPSIAWTSRTGMSFFEGCRGEGRESAGICASFRLAKSFFINKIYKKVFTKDRRCDTITS